MYYAICFKDDVADDLAAFPTRELAEAAARGVSLVDLDGCHGEVYDARARALLLDVEELRAVIDDDYDLARAVTRMRETADALVRRRVTQAHADGAHDTLRVGADS